MAVVALKKLEDQLNCAICLDTYTNPKQLQCHHVYCQKCLVKLVIRDQQRQLILTCPNCRHITPVPASGVAGLQPAFQVNQFLEILEDHKELTNKDEENAHLLVSTPSPHGEVDFGCPDHKGREMELHCNTCGEMICFKCIMKDEKHHSHDYQEMDAAFERYKSEIILSLEPLETQVTTIEKALKQLDRRQVDIAAQEVAIETGIGNTITKMQKLLEARRTELINQLHQLTQVKMKSLAAQKDKLETTLARLKSYLHLIMETLHADNQKETLLMKAARVEQIKELTTTFQSDILKSTTKADLIFTAAVDFAQTCQNFGQVSTSISPDPSKCYIVSDCANVEGTSTVILQTMNFNSKPCKILKDLSINGDVVSEIAGTASRVSVKRRSESQYEISYQPTFKGKHFLSIRVQDKPIRGSPFSVAVTLPIEELGTLCHTIGSLKKPEGVALNQLGEIVVTEKGAPCVSLFSPSGERLQSFSTDGMCPIGVAVDKKGNILVADIINDRIHKFTARGDLLATVGSTDTGPLKLFRPCSVAFNASNGKVYVGDLNHSIQILNSDLTYSGSFGRKGSGKGCFNHPEDIACDNAGNVYVADCRNHRIQVFSAEGKFMRMFGRHGGGKGELNRPHGIALDSCNRVYVSEHYNNRISVFTSEGRFVTSFGSKGSGPGQFMVPLRLAVDNYGVVYVCDYENSCIKLL